MNVWIVMAYDNDGISGYDYIVAVFADERSAESCALEREERYVVKEAVR